MILGADYGTVSDFEIIWTSFAIFGLFFSAYNLYQAWGDLKFQKENEIVNGRRVIAEFNLSFYVAMVAVQTVFALAGFLVMMLPEAPQTDFHDVRTYVGIVIRWGFLLSSGMLSFLTYQAYRVRKELSRL